MKNLTRGMISLVSALACLSVVGAGSASAEATLCKVSTAPCPAGSLYVAGEHLTGKATNTRLTASPEITCASSEITVKVTASTGAADIVKATTSGCKAGNTACAVEAKNLPYSGTADVSASGPNGILTGENGEALANCAGFINCTFGLPFAALPITGGSTASITAASVVMNKISGFLCPSSAKWDATYNVPNLWVRPTP